MMVKAMATSKCWLKSNKLILCGESEICPMVSITATVTCGSHCRNSNTASQLPEVISLPTLPEDSLEISNVSLP